MKVLIVDDSKAMRMMVMRILRQTSIGDAEVIEAENGAQGLEKARSEKPDLILSDWNMPEMDGIEFLKAARAEGITTTFGFVTTEAAPKMKAEAEAAGANFLIAKPFTPDTFQSTLEPALG